MSLSHIHTQYCMDIHTCTYQQCAAVRMTSYRSMTYDMDSHIYTLILTAYIHIFTYLQCTAVLITSYMIDDMRYGRRFTIQVVYWVAFILSGISPYCGTVDNFKAVNVLLRANLQVCVRMCVLVAISVFVNLYSRSRW
jgi:hypothetical protein